MKSNLEKLLKVINIVTFVVGICFIPIGVIGENGVLIFVGLALSILSMVELLRGKKEKGKSTNA